MTAGIRRKGAFHPFDARSLPVEKGISQMKDAEYQEFLRSKIPTVPAQGPEVPASDIHPMLFPFQRDLTRWAIRKGRAAIFADTGLGKTFMQLEWARLVTRGKALIVAPLSVARQTIAEARKLGLEVHFSRDGSAHPLTITNYEMIDSVDPSQFDAVVLDESSILKGLDGKTRAKLCELFSKTPYRLCCTATPAPNDIAEIANHAEFLGIMSRVDMLATFFVHDDEGWRLKGHAEQPFYKWLASWGMSVRKPSDLGYDDDGYILLPLKVTPVWVDTQLDPGDALFWTGLKGIEDRSRVRKGTIEERVAVAAELVNGDEDQWIVWCGLNEESKQMTAAIQDAVEVEGSDHPEDKAEAFESFQDGDIRVLVTKGKIAGFGMNFQNAHKMLFTGLSDSWELYYQCIRREWRYGQKHPVEVYVVLSEAERPIWDNVQRKQEESDHMATKLVEHVREFEKAEISSGSVSLDYESQTAEGDAWKLMMGDSVERLAEIRDESVDLSVFSPPFMSLFTYSPTARDLGNTRGEAQFFQHFRFIIDHMLRVTKPGRLCCVHVAQIPAMIVRDGYIGLKDFRGKTIVAFEDAGWIYHGDVIIDKNPQAQAIRTKSKALLFTQVHKDSSWSRPCLVDFVLAFRKPGENAVPIKPDLTNNEWIEWAGIWYGISESDTLNVAEGRDEKDERHICPLQLGTIERLIRLWSNKGETVCSPFAGIGSELYMAIKLGRRAIGCELKPSYFRTAVLNLQRLEREREQETLFGAQP